MSIEAMKQALEALETLARYENPETKIQVRKPKDGGPIVTMYPHKVASDAAATLRTAIEQPEQGQWDAIPDAFNEWWDSDYDDSTNPFKRNSPAYWAWSGWSAANKEKNT